MFNAQNVKEVDLYSECGGAPDNNLGIIPDGSMVTLRRGRAARRVKVNQDAASECIYNMFGLSKPLARIFRLQNKARYTLTYNTATKTLTIRRKPVTFYTLKVTSDPKLSRNRVVIGNGLGLSGALGITLASGDLLALSNGLRKARLRLRKISRDFELTGVFRLNPAIIQQLNLVAGKTYSVSYNQLTGTLSFHGITIPKARKRKLVIRRAGKRSCRFC
ncbi:hypothetical protein [Paenibacillus glacialis]|uniref:hypothetical protein n=1 Tax=Paenibacillus glacialis TaxID=494026 RepID=UPI0011AB30BC|nr:hypothetical protein [Paenibacillus glacialis]